MRPVSSSTPPPVAKPASPVDIPAQKGAPAQHPEVISASNSKAREEVLQLAQDCQEAMKEARPPTDAEYQAVTTSLKQLIDSLRASPKPR